MRRETCVYYFGVWSAVLAFGTWVTPLGASFSSASAHSTVPPAVAVEEDATSNLKPTVQVAADPSDLFGEISVIRKVEAPPQWQAADADLIIAATDTTASGTLKVKAISAVVAVVYLDAVGGRLRYGYGVQSDVIITLAVDGVQTLFTSGAFKLATETDSAQLALSGADELSVRLAQTAPPTPGAAGNWWTCYSTCVSTAFNGAWAAYLNCMLVVAIAEGLGVGVCAIGCVLSGPGWLACVLACGGLMTVGAILLSGGCLAGFLAVIAASLPVCAIGCIP